MLKQRQIVELYRDAHSYGLSPLQASAATGINPDTFITLMQLDVLAPQVVTALEEGMKIRLPSGQVTDDFDILVVAAEAELGVSISDLL